MKMHSISTLLIILLSLPGLKEANAHLYEIPLECEGYYVREQTWTADFDLNTTLIEISDIYIDWSGSIRAEFAEDIVTGERFPMDAQFVAYIYDSFTHDFCGSASIRTGATTYPNPEPFDLKSTFSNRGWSMLLNGQGTIEVGFWGVHRPMTIVTIEDPNGELTSATLVIEANPPEPRTITVGIGAGYDFNTIQAAIDDAYDGDTIIVADGTYTGDGNRDIDFLGKAITLRSENGPENCIIDCNGTLAEKHRGFHFHSQEDSNSVLAGFTVTNGHGLLWYPFPVPAGGAIFCKNSSPRIANCIIKNSTGGFGGGILCHSSSPVISDCTVSSNSAVEGGGMYNYENSCVELINCTFSDNFVSSDGRGGGIVNMQSNPVIRRCVFVNNYGGAAGGGVCNLDCIPTFTDCRFIGNSAPVLLLSGRCGGGGVYNAGSSPSMTNCIFSGNHGSGGDAMSNASSQPILTNCTFTGSRFTAIYNWRENINLTLRNCILWDQTENEINDSNVTITYSNVKGGWPGLGNIDADPCFADQGYWDDPCNTPGDFWDDIWIDGDYHLKSEAGRWEPNSKSWVQDDVTSPCIDAGNPGCPLGDEQAPNGNRRNMGAYGGTAEASKSPINWRSIADLTNDWVVDSNDLKVFVGYWLEPGECIPGDLNRSKSVNFSDFALLANNWLRTSPGKSVFDFGVATKGPLHMAGNIEPEGVNISIESDVYIVSENSNRALEMIGNSHITGDVFIVNPFGTVDIHGGYASIGGETAPGAYDHVFNGVFPIEFPVPNPDYFEHYVVEDINLADTTFTNVRVPPNTNPIFGGGATFNGILFIEIPNLVYFSGHVNVNGIIVGNGDATDDSGTNRIYFPGTVSSSPVSMLPEEFGDLREETGTFLMAPGFSVTFGGNFETINGAVAANGITFFGNASGTIQGTLLNYSDTEMELSNNNDLFINRYVNTEMPAGFE